MNKFVLKNTIKIYIYHILINIFYKNKKPKLSFRDCVIVLNNFVFGYGRNTYTCAASPAGTVRPSVDSPSPV